MKPLYACCKIKLQKDCRRSRERYIQKNEAGRMAKSLLSNQNMKTCGNHWMTPTCYHLFKEHSQGWGRHTIQVSPLGPQTLIMPSADGTRLSFFSN